MAEIWSPHTKSAKIWPPYKKILPHPIPKRMTPLHNKIASSRPPFTKLHFRDPLYNNMAFSRSLYTKKRFFCPPYPTKLHFDTPYKNGIYLDENDIFETPLYKNWHFPISWNTPNFFMRTLRFELHCWFLFSDGFEHQNVRIFSLIQACMFLIIYGFACFYWIRIYTTIMENVGISMSCSQYIYYTTIIFIIYSVVNKKSIIFL